MYKDTAIFLASFVCKRSERKMRQHNYKIRAHRTKDREVLQEENILLMENVSINLATNGRKLVTLSNGNPGRFQKRSTESLEAVDLEQQLSTDRTFSDDDKETAESCKRLSTKCKLFMSKCDDDEFC
uniref:Uncharacterized protein n=1 Tax=Romanomermis culicivorax TaxID=13658 RepID=A0A915HYB1_ROMCU